MTLETETTETTEPSDLDKNIVALRESKDAEIAALKAENDALRPSAQKFAIVDAGFDPESSVGKLLMGAVAGGLVKPEEGQSLTQAVAAYAESVGEKPKVQLTSAEQAQVSGSQRIDQARSSTTSSVPPEENTVEHQIESLYARAREEKDPEERARLNREALEMKNRYHMEKMLRKEPPE